ncbi:MAG: hypothetical protein MSIBF_07330 [Candidatus Altiarchaeales archaeon IMC4]|nr:MAG: hypothetical protein MSIBF_07330 [Candidatus Altiarchaeales archaeon IMC4]
MEKLLDKIIIAILKGKDHRPYVLQTINKRFTDTVFDLLKLIVEARNRNKKDSWWADEFLNNASIPKRELLWFGGLNNKTVANMANTTAREVCVDLGKKNVESINELIKELDHNNIPKIEIKIKYREKEVTLTERESLVLLNTISAMKLTLQGGAWSEVGKKVEKRLLFAIFEMMSLDNNSYILVPEKMKSKGLVGNREVDAVIFKDKNGKKLIKIELKLLGIGNPEIGDEALARGVELFLTDRMTPMMIEEGKKKGIRFIELRDSQALIKIYEYLNSEGIKVSKPSLENIEEQVKQITQKYNEEYEDTKIMKKAKELVGKK